jgi:RNA-directed DNA polymerase
MIFTDTGILERIREHTPFNRRELLLLVATAPWRYKEHKIEKRNGRGFRIIAQPTSEVKLLQRTLLKYELYGLDVHGAATAYSKGSSTLMHARPHANARYLLKLDFKDFFPSLKAAAIIRSLLKNRSDLTETDAWVITQILCRKSKSQHELHLAIGSPSSPFMSNHLMFDFDELVSEICAENECAYTRYADDIAVSTDAAGVLDKVKSLIEATLVELPHLGLTFNAAKTVNVSTKHRRTLVGLVLSNDGLVSVGRDEKRRLRASVEAFVHGRLDEEKTNKLRGQLAYTKSVDSLFVLKTCEKWGISSLAKIVYQTGSKSE